MAYADVVVAGYGAAGAAAAITAADLGASVVVLEKQAQDDHANNTMMSGGIFMVTRDLEASVTYLDRCAAGMIPEPITRRWAELASRLEAWVCEACPDLALEQPSSDFLRGAAHPFPGWEAIEVRMAKEEGRTGGLALFRALDRAVRRRPAITVRWGARARGLGRDPGARVHRVHVEGGEPVHAGAVVLSAGGFEFHEEMKRDYLRAYPVHFSGSPANTGDGIRMAQVVGADLWHMNGMVGRQAAHFTLPDGSHVNVQMQIAPPPYVVLDRHGRRFCNETAYTKIATTWYELFEFDREARDYLRIPCYWIFDERRRRGRGLTQGAGLEAVERFRWSEGGREEIANGMVVSAGSIGELAKLAGIEHPEAAEASVREFNRLCAAGGPDPWGRPPETLVPLESPPFYAVPLYPGGSNTGGGPRRDVDGRVLDVEGGAIPGLFAAGEMGQTIGLCYPSPGGSLSEALCSGQIAGRSAAALAASTRALGAASRSSPT